MKTTYYSYIRFSTPDQIKGDSLRRQLEGARAYVAKHGGVLDESKTFKDLGVSAFRGANTKDGSRLKAFLNAVETGEIKAGSCLIVEAIDRISRNEPLEQLDLIIKIIKAGISIVTLFDEKLYSNETLKDPAMLMYLQMLINRGHEESKTKSRRVADSWAMKRKIQCPMTGKCPAWLELIIDNGKKAFRKIEERCNLVKRIFQMAAAGKGKIAIAKELNQENVTSWGTGKRDRKGQATGWHPSYIQKILRNKATIGEFQPHKMNDGKREPVGKPIPDYFPKAIEPQLFYAVCGQRNKNKAFGGRKSKDATNLFSNIAFCGYCKAPMHHKDHGEWQYLVCSNAKRGLKCSCPGWPYSDFETSFLEFINDIDYCNAFSVEKADRIIQLENELALKEGLVIVSRERLEKLKALLKADASPTIIQTVTELDKEHDDNIKDAQKASADLALARQNSKRKVDLQNFHQKLTEPDFRLRLQKEIRNQVMRIEIFSNGLSDNKKERCFFVCLENGAVKQIQPDFQNPAKYKMLIGLCTKKYQHPFPFVKQRAFVSVDETGRNWELYAQDDKEAGEPAVESVPCDCEVCRSPDL